MGQADHQRDETWSDRLEASATEDDWKEDGDDGEVLGDELPGRRLSEEDVGERNPDGK